MDPLQQKTILLVDDDIDLLELGRTFLARTGMNIRTAGSGNEAIRLLDEGLRPHVILSDLNMPDGTGLDLLKSVRRRRDMSGIPVLILSATRDEREIADAEEYGCSGFRAKPVNYPQLLEQVAQLLEVVVRLAPRLDVDLEALASREGVVHPVRVRNMSTSGLYFECGESLLFETLYRLELHPPEELEMDRLELQVTIVRREERQTAGGKVIGHGGRFIVAAGHKHEVLQRFLLKAASHPNSPANPNTASG